MDRATTPPLGPSDSAPPSTPNTNATSSTMVRVQRNTPVPSTPGGHHKRMSSVPRTPGISALICSSSPASFTRVTVHTAKCSECDLRNKGTMLRCPGCTFQICKPCQDGRGKAGRSLAHGNMLSPQVATPGTGGSVVRRKPVASVKGVEKTQDGAREASRAGVGEEGTEKEECEAKRKTRVKPAPRPKLKSKVREATPSDDSSDDDFAPDPASPTSNKRRRNGLTSRTEDAFELPSRFHEPKNGARNSTEPNAGGPAVQEKPHSDMSTDELLAHHGVNTPANPYTVHLLSRDEPVLSDPIIEIPEVVKRGFKPRPTAEEIQNTIQDKVREKLGLPTLTGAGANL